MADWVELSVVAGAACFLGVLITTLISFSIVTSNRRRVQQEKALLQQEIERLREQNRQQLDELHLQEKEALTLEQQFAAAQTIWQEKESFFLTQKQHMETEFRQLAQDIMAKQQRQLAEANEKQLGAILSPLGSQIQRFQDKVEKSYDQEARERFSLVREIRNLQQLNQRISDDAGNLTQALKGQNKLQGGWGEVILERLLEKSGLEKGREYETQVSMQNEHGRRLQPDVIIHLPEGKQVVVDSKMVLNSYLAYTEAETDEDRNRAIKAHLDALRRHIRDLSSKQYQALPGVTSLDFVLLFIPIEAAFSLAVQSDNGLFSEAFEANIILTGPSNLLATLRTVQNIWRNEKQSQNAREIARQAGAMYDKLVGFVQDMDDVGNRLDMATRSYHSAVKKLNSGRGNLVSRAEQLREMGAKTSKTIPLQHLAGSEGIEEL